MKGAGNKHDLIELSPDFHLSLTGNSLPPLLPSFSVSLSTSSPPLLPPRITSTHRLPYHRSSLPHSLTTTAITTYHTHHVTTFSPLFNLLSHVLLPLSSSLSSFLISLSFFLPPSYLYAFLYLPFLIFSFPLHFSSLLPAPIIFFPVFLFFLPPCLLLSYPHAFLYLPFLTFSFPLHFSSLLP